MTTHARMSSLSLAFPEEIRSNDHWRERYPALVESAAERALARLWKRDSVESAFERAMAPYVEDPFKGALERRVVGSEGSLDLAWEAARGALSARGVGPEDVDLVMVAAMRPDTHAVGDAAFLVRRGEFRCPAINFETACSSSVLGFDTAANLVRAGRYRRILVVATCTYSRDIEEDDSLAWFLADGAGAFLVEADAQPGYLGGAAIETSSTCGAFVHELGTLRGEPALVMSATRAAGATLHDTAQPFLESTVHAALENAQTRLEDVDFFIFNTPTAWYADFGASVLGVPREKTISTYPIYTNVGPALMPANLWHAAHSGRIRPGDTVCMYAVGSASTASSVVLRWGDCSLGPAPAAPRSEHQPR